MNGERRAGSAALPATPSSAPRMQWMDTLRGVAVLLVIAFHASSVLDLYGYDTPPVLDWLNEVLAPFRMPTLVFLSGLLLRRSLAKPRREYLGGKSAKILYPSVLWTLITAAVVGLADATHPLAWIDTYLWYLNFLFVYYLLGLALRQALAKHPDVVSAAIVVAALTVSAFTPDSSVWQRFAFLGGFFFLGYWVSLRGGLLTAVLRSPWTWLAGPAALGFATAAMLFGLDRYNGRYALGIAVAVLVLAKCAVAIDGTLWARPLAAVGEVSIVYYVTHFVVIAAVFQWLLLTEVVGVWPAVLVGFGAAMAVGFVAAVGMARGWPGFRLLFEAPGVRGR